MGKIYISCFRVLSILSICALPSFALGAKVDGEIIVPDRPRVGLVLSGGGARGAAHVGVLKVLEENHIPIDMIAGTSFGAIVGGLYAAGYSADELEEILAGIDWKATLSNRAPRDHRSFRRKQDDNGFLIKFKVGFKDGKFRLPTGLVNPNNLRLTLRDLVIDVARVEDFDDLAIPFKAVATDLETGQAVVLERGNLAGAMVASMAVPALFPPVERDGKLLVDGGVANNLPVNIARAMGADIVIVVDISTPMMTRDEINSFTAVIDQLTLIMTNQTTAAQLATLTDRDILIRPELGDIGLVDFERTGEAMPEGEKSARKALAQLEAIALQPEAWRTHLAARSIPGHQQPVVDFIRIVNDTDVSDEVIEARLSQETGQKLDLVELSDDLTEIYSLELFEEVNYSIVNEDGQTGVEVRARRRENGEDHIRFGLSLQDDFQGESDYQLAVGFTNLAVNSRGGEWRALAQIGDQSGLFTEFYQPIDFAERHYAFANATGRKFNRNIIDSDGNLISQVRISEAVFQGGLGANFGRWGTARIGFQRSFGKIRGRIGFPDGLSLPFDETTLAAVFLVDTLDNIDFPHSGTSLEVIYTNSLSWLGGDSRIDAFQFGGYHPFTWGQNTLGALYRFATTFNGTPDETDLFPLGGFLKLTAFTPGQLAGNHGGTIAAVYYRRIAGGPGYLAQTPIYIGGAMEVGNVWERRSDISLGDLRWSSSLFVGADTPIGPIYLGTGIGSGGQVSAFLYVGQLF